LDLDLTLLEQVYKPNTNPSLRIPLTSAFYDSKNVKSADFRDREGSD